jgi:hypothetical protein
MQCMSVHADNYTVTLTPSEPEMLPAKFTHSAVLSVAICFLLTACGGGGGSDSPTSSATVTDTVVSGNISASNQNAHIEVLETPQAIAVALAPTSTAPSDIEVVKVQLVGYGPQITTSPALRKANGSLVATIDDLPEGITNSDWMKKTTGRKPLHVQLGAGTYVLARPWTWTPAQSGRSDSQLTIEAEVPGTAIISGSQRYVLTQAQHGGGARVDLDVTPLDLPIVDQLWVNGGRVTRARSPNAGSFYNVQRRVSSWNGQTTLNNVAVDRQAFGAVPASLQVLSGLSAAERAAAVVVAAHNWTTSYHHVQGWNAAGEILLGSAANWPFLHFGSTQRYYVENVPAALDAGGEWYQNPVTKKLSYLTTADQRNAAMAFDLPRQTQLLQLVGDAANNRWVEQINFKGLRFRYAHAPVPVEGLNDNQAMAEMQAAIQLDSARAVSITNCEVSRVGGYAIWLKSNVQRSDISYCEIYDAGAGGIKVGLTKQTNVSTATGYNTVRNNRIHGLGFQYPGGVGVWIGQSGNNAVEDNLIGDTTYSGISVGWNWDWGVSLARNNQINRNFLYNIMQGALSDGAAIYTLGVSPGTELKGNVIKNVRGFNSYGSGAWGIYNDQASSNILIDSNIVVGTDTGGYMQNSGANITVSNNIFAQGEYAEIQVATAQAFHQVSFINNRFIPTLSTFTMYNTRSPEPRVTYSSNKISRQMNAGLTNTSDCAANCMLDDNMSLNVGNLMDLPIIQESSNRVALPNQSAKSWSSGQITQIQSPALQWTQPKGGIDFEAADVAVGSLPKSFQAVPADRPDLLSVINTSDNKKCLAFQDKPSVNNRWEPHGYLITPTYSTGITTVSFTLKVDAASEFIHEWRDARVTPYLAGPSVLFSGSRGVLINNSVVAPLPVNQWITVTISATQGSSPKWTLTLRYADDTVRTIPNLSVNMAAWTTTKALFFIADGVANSTTCIGSWKIENR